MRSFSTMIKNICMELNIECYLLSKDWVFMLKKDNLTKYIAGYKFDLNPHGIGLIFDDKYALFEVLKKNKIRVIEHNIVYSPNNKNSYAIGCNNMDYLIKLYKKYNRDIVLKTNVGTCGSNVEHIKNLTSLKKSFYRLIKSNQSLSICPFYEIDYEFRTIVLNGEAKIIYKKERAVVTGDGKKSIKELLCQFNEEYFSNLTDKELDVTLKKNEKYTYDWKFNLSRGARLSETIEEHDKENIICLVRDVSKVLDLGFCSVDIIKSHNKYYILEINSGVMMENFIKQANDGYNRAYSLYKEAIMQMFK